MIAQRLRGPRGAATALFVGALFLYVWTASPLSSDSIPNAYLPVSVLADGDLAFSPFEAPSMFLWRANGTEVRIDKWSAAAADGCAAGRLELGNCKYFLVPTRRVRAKSAEPLFVGAFGPWVGLTVLPLAAGARLLLVSPSRGLLIYSPFLALGFFGAVQAWRDVRYRSLRFLTIAVLALWLPAFLWFDWWGGWSYGYRPIVDSTPLLVLVCLPALEFVLERRPLVAIFVVARIWSVFVQALGALAYTPWGWNAQGDIDRPVNRHRLWSFCDWQIGYLIANFSKARSERTLFVVY
jgi:hypothetical protein